MPLDDIFRNPLKSEIILRAIYLISKSFMQSLVLVPTTLLSRQHYLNFKKRFDLFGIKIKQLSRLVSNKDKKIESIMSASILAKVERDRIMSKLNKDFPLYFFDKHKGYPTKSHKEALRLYGPCKLHRRSFKPVQQSLR